MIFYETYNHRNSYRAVAPEERMGVETAIEGVILPEGKIVPKDVLDPIRERLTGLGWSDSVEIANGTRISISGVHSDVGIAIQFGNISRIYADLLKLQALFLEGKIDGAIILVPHGHLLKRLNENMSSPNRCSFDRVCREMPVFARVITLPILIYGLCFEEETNASE